MRMMQWVSSIAFVPGFPSPGVFTEMVRGEHTGGAGGVELTGHLDTPPLVPISGDALLRAGVWGPMNPVGRRLSRQ